MYRRHLQDLAITTILALCTSFAASAQDKIDPLEEIDANPQDSTAEDSGARFTSSLLSDAERYATGNGYKYSPTRAYELYKKAAESGNPRAVYEVAKCLILGEGVKANEKKGKSLLDGLAAVMVQSKDFNHVHGFNPILKKTFRSVKNLTPSAISIKEFKARNGSTISDPTVLSINESSVRMMHSTGITTFQWNQLPGFVHEAIGYDKVSALFEQSVIRALKSQNPA